MTILLGKNLDLEQPFSSRWGVKLIRRELAEDIDSKAPAYLYAAHTSVHARNILCHEAAFETYHGGCPLQQSALLSRRRHAVIEDEMDFWRC